jgi:hypothetical protein
MSNKIQERLDLFVANTQAIKKNFKWHDTLTKRLSALLFAFENKPADCEVLKTNHALIKSNTGVFSTFRGSMSLCIASMLSLKDNAQEHFSNTLLVYDLLKKAKLRASDYLVVAAYEIAVNAAPDTYQQTVTRAREFYSGMKAQSWFNTGEYDYIFSAMLALSDIDVKAGVEQIDSLYKQLKPAFYAKNSVQTLAQILVISKSCSQAAEKVLALREALKSQKIRLDKTYTLPSLGVLAMLPVETNILIQDILEAQDFLRRQKRFRAFSVTKQETLLLSSALVASVYADDMSNGIITASLSTSIASIIIAQQIAVIMAASASGAAAAAAASS